MFLCYSLFSSNIDQFFFASSLFLSFKMKKTVIAYLRGRQPTARVPQLARQATFSDTQKLQIYITILL